MPRNDQQTRFELIDPALFARDWQRGDSLPGGVFSSAGAGVKTNLLFFTKGRETGKIWYYDMSDVKVGKKSPLTRAHFDEFFRLLPTRSDSPQSWTVDIVARVQRALSDARPLRERAVEIFRAAESLEETLRIKREATKRVPAGIARLEAQWKAALREARDQQARAEAIENAAYDLKAVNPNRADDADSRTPAELLDAIGAAGREVDAALGRLRTLLASPGSPPVDSSS